MTAKAAILLLLSTTAALAAAGKTSGLLLKEPFGARPFAMGEAYAALGDDIFGMNYNPAALSRLQQSQAATEFTKSIADAQLGYVGIASPLSPYQALGLSVKYLDLGKLDIYDNTGATTRTVSAERDILIQMGYAHSFTMETGKLHVGAGAKLLNSVIVEEVRGSAYAGDLGAIYEYPLAGGLASAGAAMANFGPGIKYSGGLASGSQTDPLPLTARAALGFSKDVFSSDAIAAGLETDRVFYDDMLFEALGLEYNYHGLAAMRFGYRFGQDSGGLSLGVGLKFKNLAIDYGFGLMQTFNSVQQISVSYGFNIPGIRYRESSPPSPLETLVDNARKDIASRRFFDARTEVDKIQTFFSDSDQIPLLKTEIDRQVDQVMITSPETSPNTLDARIEPGGSAQYNYALGFRKYYAGAWQEAAAVLEKVKQLEPDNREIDPYLRKARKSAEDERKQFQLQRGARIATLFELANQAYDDKDYTRALKIIAEILRTGPYQPAADLRLRIDAESRKPKIDARPIKPPPPPASTAPAPHAPSATEVQRAEDLYYEALRDYSDNRIGPAIEKLRDGLQLNPASEPIRRTLDFLEKQRRQQ